ncbi:hypothetical protein HBI60_010760 [Parastagonospora nodorum]|nr:hypothetical protein HBI51_011090 [Parastagonospora nodorum]KAH6408728.1 hypothetical protein HBI60_010760 [Parastagonospora nodorum]KAH6457016.1 hypothetical protein HBI57_114430 [Parastagonospora nodorum]KAH6480482.1 hypothetical protein HBI58_079460 [Parastagonospora nodorum]
MAPSTHDTDLITKITSNASHSSIDLTTLPFHQEALTSIAALSSQLPATSLDFSRATKIDTHTHPIPPWFRALEPLAAGRATPEWNMSAHVEFMASRGIKRSMLSVSTPQGNAFTHMTDSSERRAKTIALARLLNEYVAEVCRLLPGRFSWLCVTALPYVDASIEEVRYAIEELGAAGVAVLTNAEGRYVGDEENDGLWGYLDRRGKGEVVFVHPTEPVIRLEDGRVVGSRPCEYYIENVKDGSVNLDTKAPLRSGLGEFYFETARAISSITANKTITKFPNLRWRVSHGAGAFPDISERFLLGFPDVAEEARKAYKQRFWYDIAGPVFPNQVKGLTEGMKIPISQMVFGTDYPYGIGFWDVDANIAGLTEAEFLTEEEKEGVYWRNAKALWGDRID